MAENFFIDTESLAQNLGREGLVIIDVRGRGAYTSHIPGAVHTTWHEYSDPSAVAKGVLDPDLGKIEQRLRSLGINQSSDVVIYCNPFDNWGDEGRMFWMLTYLGHASVRILDGGWVKWTAEQRPIDHEAVRPTLGDFTATANPELIVNKEGLKKLLKTPHPDTIILDARSVEEYAGKEIDGLPRAGHIPSAINIPWNRFLQPDATVKPPEQVKEIFEDHGLRDNQEIMTYCLGGVRAAWVFCLLRYVGFPRVKVYPGSWWEWSRDFAAPAEKDVKLLFRVTNQDQMKSS
ncbi:MAG: sulfurtransferase [Nitrospirales bacterium]|nr:MAG: sulfurtransferase [Nitrospirales bacterium]